MTKRVPKNRKFRCDPCQRYFSGPFKLGAHFRRNPTHRSPTQNRDYLIKNRSRRTMKEKRIREAGGLPVEPITAQARHAARGKREIARFASARTGLNYCPNCGHSLKGIRL